MGLGKSDAYIWKKIITAWFPNVEVNPELIRGEVTIVIEDFCLKFYNIQASSYSVGRIDSEVRKHPGRIFAKFPEATRYVCLIDDPNDVPSSKRPTQVSRDEDDDQFTPDELKRLGKRAYLSQLVDGNTDWIDREYKAETDAYNALQAEKGNTGRRRSFGMFMTKLMNTRCGNRKLDVYHRVGRVMLGVKRNTFRLFGLERTMILDGATLPRDDKCRRLIDDTDSITMEEFDSYVPGKKYPTDNVVFTSEKTVRSNTRYVKGESDIKLVSWLLAELERAGPKSPQTVWVCCCDTDAIPILLLNMYKLIDPETGNIPHRVYLDLTYKTSTIIDLKTLSEEDQERLKENPEIASKWSVSTTLWDMVALWRHIHKIFGACFPGITRPVELFCTVLVLGATDFVTRLADAGIAPLWEAFRIGGYTLLMDAVKTPRKGEAGIQKSPKDPLTGLPLALDPPRDIVFNEDAIYRFARFLYMVKLSSAHSVSGDALGFDPATSDLLHTAVIEKLGKGARGKGLGSGVKGSESALNKAIKELAAAKGALILEGGYPILALEEAQQLGDYFRMSDLYLTYHAKLAKLAKARAGVRTASSHNMRHHTVRQMSFHLTPRMEDIHGAYDQVKERKKKSMGNKVIPGETELRGYARRAAWNLDYWFRGWHSDWKDRSLDVAPDGTSISGWAVTPEGGIKVTNDIFSPKRSRVERSRTAGKERSKKRTKHNRAKLVPIVS